MNIILLDPRGEIISFIDPDLCEIEETQEISQVKSIKMTYKFVDFEEEKYKFKIGNKIFVSNHPYIEDCLYVINTKLTEDLFGENQFVVPAEEVLVELLNAPVFTQNELVSANGFTYTDHNGKREVTIDWNALCYWFGDYFNIGVIQDVSKGKLKKMSITGTISRLQLLRDIESVTGNVFVTRYEKDVLTNTIHGYLDFLNPLSVKNWEMNIEYDFYIDYGDEGCFDGEGNPTDEDPDFDDTIFVGKNNYSTLPENMEFRVTNNETVLVSRTADEIGLTETDNDILIQLSYNGEGYGLTFNNKSYVYVDESRTCDASNGYVEEWSTPLSFYNATIPNGSYFEIYDLEHERVIYRTKIRYAIGMPQIDLLSFTDNINDIQLEIDETNTVQSTQPVLSIDSLTYSQMNTLINDWINFEVEKGEIIPLSLSKFMIKAETLTQARQQLGTVSKDDNYYARYYNPNDKKASSAENNEWEFYRAISYTRAPFTKRAGEIYISSEMNTGSNAYVTTRPDQNGRDNVIHTKMGNISTKQENLFLIYNELANNLKQNQYPQLNLTVDVANLKDNEYNNYSIYDKVNIKVPGYKEFINAKIEKTVKYLHEIGKNTVTLSNYSINDHAQQDATYIDADNTSWYYPHTKNVTARLINQDYNSQDPQSIQYPPNQLISFQLYKVEKNSKKIQNVYNKITNEYGQASINLKIDPGDYTLNIVYGGSEEFLDSNLEINLTVGGYKPETKKNTKKQDKKTTQSSKRKTKQKTATTIKKGYWEYHYWDQWGRSPDKLTILAIGKISAGSKDPDVSYANYYACEFINKCPHCGKPTLAWGIHWAKGNYGKFLYPNGVKQGEGSSLEGGVYCQTCDADFSIFGADRGKSHKHLTHYKKSKVTGGKKYVKSSRSAADKLKAGILLKEKIKRIEILQQQANGAWISKGMPNSLIKKARSIVGTKVGTKAAEKIVDYCAHKIDYSSYSEFHHSPTWVNRNKRGNCCDQARYCLALLDAAGLQKMYKLSFVHVTGGKGGHVFCRLTTRATGKTRVVDPCKTSPPGPWGHYVHGYGKLPGRETAYGGWNQVKDSSINSTFRW